MQAGTQGQLEIQECQWSKVAGKQVTEEEMAVEGSLWLGDCVTGKKMHCVVYNALKADIKTHCTLSPLCLFTPFCSLPLYLLLVPHVH